MAKYTVDIPSRMTHRKMTANQFLAEFRMRGKNEPRTSVYTLTHPVKMVVVHQDRTATVEKFTESLGLFRRLSELYRSKSIICCVSTKHWSLGAYDMYILNHAVQTAALRKNGHNIVSNFLRNRTHGGLIPLRCDLASLFSYLEIRPVSTPPLPSSKKRNAIYYVYNGLRHNVVRIMDGKIRPHAKAKITA